MPLSASPPVRAATRHAPDDPGAEILTATGPQIPAKPLDWRSAD